MKRDPGIDGRIFKSSVVFLVAIYALAIIAGAFVYFYAFGVGR